MFLRGNTFARREEQGKERKDKKPRQCTRETNEVKRGEWSRTYEETVQSDGLGGVAVLRGRKHTLDGDEQRWNGSRLPSRSYWVWVWA